MSVSLHAASIESSSPAAPRGIVAPFVARLHVPVSDAPPTARRACVELAAPALGNRPSILLRDRYSQVLHINVPDTSLMTPLSSSFLTASMRNFQKLHEFIDAEKLVGVSSVYAAVHGDAANNVMRLRFAFVHI
nr:hypothetical protein [Burkholderia lata]